MAPRLFLAAFLLLQSEAFAATLLWESPPAGGGPTAFSADGKYVIRGSSDGVQVYDFATGRSVNTLPGGFSFYVPPNPEHVALLNDRILSMVRIEDGAVLRTHAFVRDPVFLDNGTLVYPADNENRIYVKNAYTGETLTNIASTPYTKITANGNRFIVYETTLLPPGQTNSQLFSFEGGVLKRTLIPDVSVHGGHVDRSGARVAAFVPQPKNEVVVYDVANKSVLWKRELAATDDRYEKAVWLANDSKLLVSALRMLALLDAETGATIWVKTNAPYFADISPDHTTYLSGDFGTIYDVETGVEKTKRDFGFGDSDKLAISPDQKRVVYVNSAGSVMSRDLSSGSIHWHVTPVSADGFHSTPRRFAVSSDGSLLAVTRTSERSALDTHLVDAQTGTEIKMFRTTLPSNPDLWNSGFVGISPNKKRLALGNRDAVGVMDIETGEMIRSWRPVTNVNVFGVSFIRDDDTVLAAISGSSMKLLSVNDGSSVTITNFWGINISPNGALMATVDNLSTQALTAEITIRNTTDFSTVRSLIVPYRPMGIIFSADSETLYVAAPGEVSLWRLSDGQRIGSIPIPGGETNNLLAASGNYLALRSDHLQIYSALSPLRASIDQGVLNLNWDGLAGPFRIESASSLKGPWTEAAELNAKTWSAGITPQGNRFFRLNAR